MTAVKSEMPCGYTGCRKPADLMGMMTYPKRPVYRCRAHGGHHNFTHERKGKAWKAIRIEKINERKVKKKAMRK